VGISAVGVAYRGVEEELGRILAPFFVALVRLIFCKFVEAAAGSGVGGTGSRVLLTVAIAAATVNVGALGMEGTGSRAVQTFAIAADITNIGALGIGGTGSRMLLTVTTAEATVGATDLLALAIAAAAVGMEESGGARLGTAREVAVGSRVLLVVTSRFKELMSEGRIWRGFFTLVILNGQTATIILGAERFKGTI
jgi:hypothetical protein